MLGARDRRAVAIGARATRQRMPEKEHYAVGPRPSRASRYDGNRRFANVTERVLRVLAPEWRWMLVIAATGFLYLAGDFPYLKKPALLFVRPVLIVACGVLAIALMWLASRPTLPGWVRREWRNLPAVARWRGWRALIVVALMWLTYLNTIGNVGPMLRGQYTNDAIAYVHVDAQLLQQHRNLYTANSAFWQAALRWPKALATPLVGGKILGENPLDYPTWQAIYSALQYETTVPQARQYQDFDPRTVHNYPAGIAWLALPVVAAGVPSVIWLNFLALAGLVALTMALAPPPGRLATMLVVLANPILPLSSLFANFDVVCIFFVVAAWQTMRHGWLSALLFGFACAVKQVAWFFLPFYFIEVVRREGWAAGFRRGGWAALAFLVPNLPFIIASPGAWLHSIFIPMADPMFPMGIGLVSLALNYFLPLWRPVVWTALEGLSLVGLSAFQWLRRVPRSDGLFLALLPLWLSWRSPLNYFAFLPLAALWLGLTYQQERAHSRASDEPLVKALPPLRIEDLVPAPATVPEPDLVGV